MLNSLQSWLSHIVAGHPKEIALGLDRMAFVAKRLQLGQFTCPVVMVGGTNGKGSCVACLQSVYLAAGYRVAAYTSPHLYAFNERLTINGKSLGDAEFCRAFSAVEASRGETALTFFEFTTLAALWHLHGLSLENSLDIIILEVGLGGRLDAVNLMNADLAIVTNVALDHTDYLGNSREQIGREKAGIFRQNQLAIYGDPQPVATVQAYAERVGADVYCMPDDFSVTIDASGTHWSCSLGDYDWPQLPIPALPLYSVACALVAVRLLGERFPQLALSDTICLEKLVTLTLPGRFQYWESPAPTILDVAHNPAASQWLIHRLRASSHYPGMGGQLRVVVGMLADKDIAASFAPWIDEKATWYLAGLTFWRGAAADVLARALPKSVLCYKKFATVVEAYHAAVSDCQPGDLIVVFGSFHTVGELLTTTPDNQ